MLLKLTQEHLDQTSNILDHGWYKLYVEDMKIAEAKTDKSTLYVFTMKVLDADDEPNKRLIGKKTFFQISEKGIGFGIPFLRACGANIPDKIAPGAEITLNPEACVGKTIKGQNNPGLDKNKVMRNNWAVFTTVND
jgi:hypothetical protein